MTIVNARSIRSCLSFCAQVALFVGVYSDLCAAQTVTTFDVLVATGNLTVVGTTTVQGNAFSIGGSTLAVISGNVGIGTGTPTAQLHLVGPVVYLSSAQLRWIASKAALRAGEVVGTNWDLSNVGINSIALGFNPLNIQPFGTISGGYSNAMNYGNGYWGVIGGGDSNNILGFTSDANAGTIGGGQSNLIKNYSAGTIGGGAGNNVFSAGGTIAGGGYNSVGVDGLSNSYATVGGGAYNHAYAYASVIAGGGAIGPAQTNGGNIIDQDATGASILGGANNNAKKSYSSIGGGAFNVAGGAYASVIGGYNNSASGDYSFAAGSAAVASARGSFVWADSQNRQLISNTTDEFKIRAGGGFVLLSSPTLATIIVSSGSLMISTSATAAMAVPNIFVSSTNGNVGIGMNSPVTALDVNGAATASSATLTATGNNIYSLTSSSGIHILAGGITWADGSTSTTAASGGGGGASCTGISCRVGYSSGTWNSFEFVLQSSSTYELYYAITVTSGTSSTFSTFKCTVNGNTTAANYAQFWNSYPIAYDINNAGGGVPEIALNSCGTGAVNAGDFANGKLKFETVGQGNLILSYSGTVNNSCQSQTKTATLTAHTGGGYYGGSPPWTIKCWPLSTLGWYHNVRLYKVD